VFTNIAKAIFNWLFHKVFHGRQTAKRSMLFKKVSSYVKIAIICCTHSFYTQLTSSPCIHRKKKDKNQERQKRAAKKICFKKCSDEESIVKFL